MLRRTLRTAAHQKSAPEMNGDARHPLEGSRKGRHYNYAYNKYGPWGYGVGRYINKKDRTPILQNIGTMDFPRMMGKMPLSDVTRKLSPQWVPYALADGGVLFTHPTSQEVLQWSHECLREERKATGMSSIYDAERDTKIKILLERNTIEAQPIEAWRRKHILELLGKRISRQRCGVPVKSQS